MTTSHPVNLVRAKARRGSHDVVLDSMNRTEQRYAVHLEEGIHDGELIEWRFEALKLRLADKTYYTPDFLVVRPDGTLELHEVKGSWKAPHQEDSRVKLKVAAEQFRIFTFVAVTKGKGGWEFEHFGPGKQEVRR